LATLIQRSFAGGEITPALYARVDQTKYAYGLRTLRNFFVMRHGGAANRPGTKFVREVKDSNRKTVLKPFVFNEQDTYILEFGHKYLRFIRDGGLLLGSSESVLDISSSNPAIITLGATGGSTVPAEVSAYNTTSVVPPSGLGLGFRSNANSMRVYVQKYTPNETINIKRMELFLMHDQSTQSDIDYTAEIKIDIFADNGSGQPDFTNLIYSSSTTPTYPNSTKPELVNFDFNGELLQAGVSYWIYPDNVNIPYTASAPLNHVPRFGNVNQVTFVATAENGALDNKIHFFNSQTNEYQATSSYGSFNIIHEEIVNNITIDDTQNIILDVPEFRNTIFSLVSIGNNQFELRYEDGTPVDGALLAAYTNLTASSLVELETEYLESDLCDIQINQSADVVIITHPNYRVQELKRLSSSSFSLNDFSIDPVLPPPDELRLTIGTTGTVNHTYVVTSIADADGAESVATEEFTVRGGAALATQSVAVSWDVVQGASTYNIYKEENGVFGLLSVVGASNLSATTFRDVGVAIDTTITPPTFVNPFQDFESDISSITNGFVTKVVYTGPDDYIIGDVVRFSGVVGMTELNDNSYRITDVTPANKTITIDVDSNSFGTYVSGGSFLVLGNYPSSSTFYQQRLVFTNTDNRVETVWASRSGKFKNFTKSSVLADDESIEFTMAGRQVNEIRHLVDLGRLIAFTSSGEWTIEGDASSIVTPTAINPRKHSYNGSNNMQPIVINGSAIYVQARGSIVRDLGFDFQVDGYRGNDLTLFSAHLFDDYSLVDWAYQQVPHSVLWVVRSDGALLSLTYIREQQMTGWARHDFDGGFVESVAVVPEGNEDVLYVVVRREIDGRTTRYIERMHSRNIVDLTDNIFMDSALSYDGRNTGDTTVRVSGGTDWTYNEKIMLSSSSDLFSSADIGNQIHVRYSIKQGKYIFDYQGDKIIRFTIVEYIDENQVMVKPHRTVDVELRDIDISSFGKAVDELEGLQHLEGKEVSIFADKFAVASPYNNSFQKYKVENGKLTLDKPYVVIHVGLPYISDIETLDMDSAQSESMIDKVKNPTHVAMHVEESRGVFAGYKPPDDDCEDALESLQEFTVRENENYDDPVDIVTGVIEANIQSEYNKHGRVFIRQVDPVPLSILAVAPAGYYVVR